MLTALQKYNFFLDAKAADIVFHSEVPITLVPLDALSFIESLPIELYRTLVKSKRNQFADFVFNNINPFLNYSRKFDPSFWSVVTAALMLDDSIGSAYNLNLKINLDIGPFYGMVSIDRLGVPVDVCLSVNYLSFFNTLLNELIRD